MGALLVWPSLQSTGALRNIEKGSHLNRGCGDLVPSQETKARLGRSIGRQRVHSSAEAMNVMNEEFATVLEAIRRAQAELAAYLSSRDHDAELTIAKLVGILDRREVVGATRQLHAVHNSPPAPRIG
jgi:hypothetical protein